MSQSTAKSKPMLPVGILMTLHNMATITIAALGTAAEDILAKVQAKLKIQCVLISYTSISTLKKIIFLEILKYHQK